MCIRDRARNGQIVAAAHNTRETEKNALHHAELLAIDAACKAEHILSEQTLEKIRERALETDADVYKRQL